MREVKNMYLDLAKELKRNTKLMEHTFEKFNLQVLQFTYRPCSDNDADCKLIIELETIDEEMMEDDASIKVNLYDENGEIILTQECFIDSDLMLMIHLSLVYIIILELSLKLKAQEYLCQIVNHYILL